VTVPGFRPFPVNKICRQRHERQELKEFRLPVFRRVRLRDHVCGVPRLRTHAIENREILSSKTVTELPNSRYFSRRLQDDVVPFDRADNFLMKRS